MSSTKEDRSALQLRFAYAITLRLDRPPLGAAVLSAHRTDAHDRVRTAIKIGAARVAVSDQDRRKPAQHREHARSLFDAIAFA